MPNKNSHILKSDFGTQRSCQNHHSFSIPRVSSEFGYYWCYDPRVTSKRLFSPSWDTLSIQFPFNQAIVPKCLSSTCTCEPTQVILLPCKVHTKIQFRDKTLSKLDPKPPSALCCPPQHLSLSVRAVWSTNLERKYFAIEKVIIEAVPQSIWGKSTTFTFYGNRHPLTPPDTLRPFWLDFHVHILSSATRICCQNQCQTSGMLKFWKGGTHRRVFHLEPPKIWLLKGIFPYFLKKKHFAGNPGTGGTVWSGLMRRESERRKSWNSISVWVLGYTY